MLNKLNLKVKLYYFILGLHLYNCETKKIDQLNAFFSTNVFNPMGMWLSKSNGGWVGG